MDPTTRTTLQTAQKALLHAHKAILEEERRRYELAHGRVASAMAFLQLLLNDPWFAWIRPMSGLAAQMDEALFAKPGEFAIPAAKLLEEGQLYVRIYVPETVLGHIALGQKVAIRVDSFPKETFPGVVQHINSVGEYSPRNLQTADERADQVFATRVGIESGVDRLRAGMAATIEVPR